MEEKTAKIPSLKEFKESRMERDAQSQRSSSMQTKKQLQKNISKSSKSVSSNAKNASSSKKKSASKSQNDTNRRRTSADSRGKAPTSARSKQTTDRRSSATRAGSGHRSSEQAPRMYARDRIRQERTSASRESSNSTRSSYAPLHQYRSQNASRRTSPQPNRAQRTENTQQTKVKKPSRPISPKARKFRSFVVYIAIVLVVVVVGVVLSLTVLFKTESINVSGNEIYSAEDIIKASGLYLSENIFTSPKGRASDRIEKAYPYIEEADIYFVIPDTINIDVKMATPSYMVEAVGGFYIVSDTGKVLEISSTDDEVEVPVIEGVNVSGVVPGEYMEYGSDIVTTSLQEIFSAFKALGCEKITAVNVENDNDGTVKFRYVYDNRIVVYLGMPDHLTYKIQTADTILREKIDVNNAAVAGELDVSTCHEGKKRAYFNEYSLLPDNVAPTQSPTEATQPNEDDSYNYY